MEDLVPSDFFLSQNTPNPFKGITRIKYCLPVKTRVQLNLLNSNGRKIKALVNKIQEAGTYEVEIDGHDLSERFCYYQLRAVDPELSSRQLYTGLKKMTIIR